nr:uncharacterized protein LOC122271222 [Parasteatoda tepidariorum]
MTTTTLSIICLNDLVTYDAPCLQALLDGNVVKLLLNIIEAEHPYVRRSQFAALRCLRKLCDCRILQKDIINTRGIQLLFKCLNHIDCELMLESIYMIADVSIVPASWESVRLCEGMQKLIHLLNTYDSKITLTTQTSKSEIFSLKLTISQYSAKSLSVLCADECNRKIACSSNIMNACQFWIRSKHQQVTTPILILLQHLSLSVFSPSSKERHLMCPLMSLLIVDCMALSAPMVSAPPGVCPLYQEWAGGMFHSCWLVVVLILEKISGKDKGRLEIVLSEAPCVAKRSAFLLPKRPMRRAYDKRNRGTASVDQGSGSTVRQKSK